MRRVLVLGVCTCTLAGLGGAATSAGAAPAEVRGAVFAVAASDDRARLSGRGILDVDAPHGGGGSLRATRTAGGATSTITLQITSWRLELLQPVARLVLAVRVAESTDRAGCRRGVRGAVTIVDDPDGADLARVALPSRCRAFAATWASADGDTVRARVTAIER
jgi:hypothetical protein